MHDLPPQHTQYCAIAFNRVRLFKEEHPGRIDKQIVNFQLLPGAMGK